MIATVCMRLRLLYVTIQVSPKQTGCIAGDHIGNACYVLKCSIIMRLHVTKHNNDSIPHGNIYSDVEGEGGG